MGESMAIIREYASEMEATVAQSVLEANNIPSVVLRDNAGGMLPAMHYVYPLRLAVRVGDAELALELLDFTADDPGDDPLTE
jgi:Putative prokaryotic signal transducing protein